MRVGDKVKFNGYDKVQAEWGHGDDPRGKLVAGEKYTIAEVVDEGGWVTFIRLEGIEGRYNNVMFKPVRKKKAK